MEGRLNGKSAVITGAAGGIGKATAELFRREGAQVLLVDKDAHKLKDIQSQMNSEKVHIVEADLSSPKEIQKYADAGQNYFGSIDIFFNNAGVEGISKPFDDYPDDVFEEVVNINLRSVWYGCKFTAPLLSNGGSIILTSSVAGLKGFSGLGPYVATKHAVTGIMKVLALELADRNIRVNAIHPGPVNNRMMRSIEAKISPDNPDMARKEFENKILFHRYAENEEIAKLVLFLASQDSAYITGTSSIIDGGMLLA